MCGLLGFAGKVKKKRREAFETFMTALAVETQVRGEHATGLAAYMGDKRLLIGKGPVNAAAFVTTPVWKRALVHARSMIGHCRYATHGHQSKNENNHPFEQGRWALIHNGVISGYRDLARRHNVELATECDSEVILRVIAKYAKDGDAREGMERFAVSAMNCGRYAIALIDRTTGLIRLMRDEGSPCVIMRVPAMNIVAFASTDMIMMRAFRTMLDSLKTDEEREALKLGVEGWELKKHKVYVLSPETFAVEHEEIKMPNWWETGNQTESARETYGRFHGEEFEQGAIPMTEEELRRAMGADTDGKS